MISKQEFDNIPIRANKVIVTVPYKADSLFGIMAKVLSKNGWPSHSDKTLMQISTDGKSIGSGANVKLAVYIEPNPSGSSAHITGQWGLDAYGQVVLQAAVNQSNYSFAEIVFDKKGTTKSDMAMQQMVLLAKQVPGGILNYEIKELPMNSNYQALGGSYPEKYSTIIDKPMDNVWNGIVDFCYKKNLAIKAIDKASGIVITGSRIYNQISYSFENPDGSIQLLNADFVMSCEKIGGSNKCIPPNMVKTDFNFRAKDLGDKTELTIQLTNIEGTAKNGNDVYKIREVKSTGAVEKATSEEIKSIL